MSFPTLEEIKSFEVGSKGLFLILFDDLTFNIMGGSKKYFPARSVNYDFLSMSFKEIELLEVSIPYEVKYPKSISIEYIDDYRETIQTALKDWYLTSHIYKTGRLPREYDKETKNVKVLHYDKDGKGGLRIVSVDSFRVFLPDQIVKSVNQGVEIKASPLTFNISGNIKYK